MRTLALIVMVVSTLKAPAADTVEESASKIKELQKERIATLTQMADVLHKLAIGARVELGEALEARQLLLKAELEVAEKESDRISLCQKYLGEMKQYEEIAQARKNAARGTDAPIFKAKAMRLEAEIYLEKAKAKETKESK